MGKGRLEAFFDAVVAVAITIMVLELKPPHGAEPAELLGALPIFLSYILSFIYIGIYWVNHHHFYYLVHKISGGMLWANLHLLFWLSLIPFTTGWMGENHFAMWPVVVYALNLLACAIAYTIMSFVAVGVHGAGSDVAKAVGRDKKGKISLVIYLLSLPLAFINPMLSCACFVAVALIWFIPDRRIERVMGAGV
ncbi:TMEM175 family protein [Aestuariivirga litoralis]|uniref:TMEM175 family protein n=1 Tax=Aestuariivirga litoralis TaxID=2650924 RepID=UPI0018C463D0|nr:TMEM175 family protein [Aestuariivirga litoralis]MBG1231167.1 DUF1211 domain-containing protein [Aestuariivirga litoralis]